MEFYIAQPKDYWIAPNAISITLNALGEANRTQCGVASGAAILCYIKGIKPAGSEAPEGEDYSKNGDGLEYDNGHNYKRWPLTISPTFFNDNEPKYVYAAIPRSASIGTQAIIVFPSEELDIYGRALRKEAVEATDGQEAQEAEYEQIGSENYFYIFLQAIITAPQGGQRDWEHAMEWGTLSTDEALATRDEDWYRWDAVAQTVTFLKEIAMGAESIFSNLKAKLLVLNGKELKGVAVKGETPSDSDDMVVTPSYLDGAFDDVYLRKDQDDHTDYSIGIGGNLEVGGHVDIFGNTVIGGNADIAGDASAKSLTVNGQYGISEDGIITGSDVNASGNAAIEGDATVGGSANIGGDASVGGNATVDGKAVVDGEASVGGNLNVGKDVTLEGILYAKTSVRSDEIRSTNYTGDGMADTGFLLTNGIERGIGHSKLTVDELYVRMKAVFESLEVKKWQVSAGDQIYSCAANIINRVDYYDNTSGSGEPLGYTEVRVPWLLKRQPFLLKWFNRTSARWMYSKVIKIRKAIDNQQLANVRMCRCYFLAKDNETEIENWWQVGDLARCQTMNIISTSRQTYTTTATKAGNVMWWRKVIRVSAYNQPVELDDGKNYHYFDVPFDITEESKTQPTSWCMKGSDIPAAGDHVSQFGNVSNSDRMNLMTIEINGSANQDAPCIKAYMGIYTFSTENSWWGGKCQKMKLSPRTGYEFYGPSFRFIEEHGVARAEIQRGAWTSVPFSLNEYGGTQPTYSDDIVDGSTRKRSDGSDMSNVRKCYYYDKVSHKGCEWLCVIANGDSAHWVHYNDTTGKWEYSAAGPADDADRTKWERRENFTMQEPGDGSIDWLKLVDRGTSIRNVETRYGKKSPTEQNPGTVAPYGGAAGWVTDYPAVIDDGNKDQYVGKKWLQEQHIPLLGLQSGDYLWTCTRTEYSDTLEPTFEVKCSRWGIDGDGIYSINSYYLGTSNTSVSINSDNDKPSSGYYMPGDTGYDDADTQHKWYDTFDEMAQANGGVGEMQGWNVWEKTIIHYDQPTGKTDPQKPDVISYKMTYIGIDGMIGQEEYYCLRESDVIEKAFKNGTKDGGIDYCGISWYRGSYAQSDGGRLADVEHPISNIWSTSRPQYQTGSAAKYLWNTEQRVDGQGTEYATRPICIGDASRGIIGVIEVYALSASNKPTTTGRHIPNDIWTANGNSETDYSHSSATDQKTWSDEKYDRAPTEQLPYQWNWTRTLYSAPKDASDTARYIYNGVSYPYEDHYHVSAVRGTKGEDGAGTEYIYCLVQTHYTEGDNVDQPIPGATYTDPNVLKDKDGNVVTAEYIKANDDFVPYKWTDNPQGVDSFHQVEYQAERKSKATKGEGGFTGGHEWSLFATPKIWSKWGERGEDGDGVEYCFMRTKKDIAPNLSSSVAPDSAGRSVTSDEWLPSIANKNNCGAESTECTDDPKGTTAEYPYEWVGKRTKGTPNPRTGVRTWRSYYNCMEKTVGTDKTHQMVKWSTYTTLRLDIDNEMDGVRTDSTGKVEVDTTIKTKVHLFDGASLVSIGNPTVADISIKNASGNTVTLSPTITPSGNSTEKTISWTFGKGVTINERYDIGISYTYNDLPYTATFTIVASMGRAVYRLQPSVSELTFTRKSDNTLNAPSAVSLVVTKIDGSGSADLSSFASTGTIDGGKAYVRYSKTSMPTSKTGTPWTGNVSVSVAEVTASTPVTNLYIAVFDADGFLHDRETLPVVKDGSNGSNGDTPINLYRWSPANTPLTADDKPTTTVAQYDAGTTVNNWSKYAPNRPSDSEHHLWVSQNVRSVSKAGVASIGTWSDPIRISGDKGSPGEDAEDVEWIYRAYTEAQTFTSSNRPKATSWTDSSGVVHKYTDDDFVPKNWNDNPTGVSLTDRFEYAWWREKSRGVDVAWDSSQGTDGWQGPILWSHYGHNGMDGDGVEYVFARTTTATPPKIKNNTAHDGTDYTQDEFLPAVSGAKTMSGTSIVDQTYATDDPMGVTEKLPYEWVAKRTKAAASTTEATYGERKWKEYELGDMQLWSNFAFNSVRIDLDNQADLVSLDSEGKVRFDRTIVVKARVYDGGSSPTSGVSKDDTLTAVNLRFGSSTTGCTPTVSAVSSGVVTITWAFTKGMVITAGTKNISLKYGNVTYTAVFTLGTTDADAIWQVMPNPSEVSFTKNSSNVLTPSSQTLKCGYTKSTGSGTESVAEATVTSGQIGSTGMYLYYRTRGSNNSWGSWSVYTTSGISVSSSTTVKDYEFCISTATSSGSVADGNIIDRECVPVVKDGIDGTSPYLADLDNEMDSVACTSAGAPSSQQTVKTNVSLYKGDTPISINSITVYDASYGTTSTYAFSNNGTKHGVTVSYSTGSSPCEISFTFATSATFVDDKRLFKITMSNTTESVSRDLYFTVNGIKPGPDGKSPTIYNLLPSQSQISVGRTSSGGYNPSTATLTCGYIAKTGDANPTVVADAPVRTGSYGIDGKYNIYFRRRNRGGDFETYYYCYTYTSNDYRNYLNQFSVASYDAVEFVICTNTAYRISSPSDVIDRETVPVVSDGEQGPQGNDSVVATLTPNVAMMNTDENGKLESEGSSSHTFTFFSGSEQQSAGVSSFTFTMDSYSIGTTYGSGSTPPSFCKVSSSTSNGTFTVYIKSGHTLAGDEVLRVQATKTVNGSSVTRIIDLPISAIKQGGEGPQGDDAVVYQLLCSPDVANFKVNAVGDYTGTVTITCTIMKTEGNGTPTTVTPGSTSGIYIFYKKKGAPSDSWSSYNTSTGTSVTASEASDSSYPITAVEFVLCTQSTYSSSKVIFSKTVPVVLDGKMGPEGPSTPGTPGKIFYSMGEWSSSITYSRTGDYIPMVHYGTEWNSALECYGKYYYLTADSASGSSKSPENTNYWTEATNYGVVITQGLFAEFAKLGKAVFSGDFMFSMNGSINGVQYAAGQKYNSKPAYTYFASPSRSENYENITGYTTTNRLMLMTVYVPSAASVTFRIAGTVDYGTESYISPVYLRVFNESETEVGSISISRTKASDQMVLSLSAGTYTLKYNQTREGNIATFTISYEMASGFFEPSWYVDLLTGKMVAAKGNFVALPNGDVSVSGTIRAKNLYHSVCLALKVDSNTSDGTYNVKYTVSAALYITNLTQFKNDSNIKDIVPNVELDKLSTGMLVDLTDTDNFPTLINQYNNNAAFNGAVPCIGYADIVIFSTPQTQGSGSNYIFLPPAEKCIGKMVTIYNKSINGTDCDVKASKSTDVVSSETKLSNGVPIVSGYSGEYIQLLDNQYVTMYAMSNGWLALIKGEADFNS